MLVCDLHMSLHTVQLAIGRHDGIQAVAFACNGVKGGSFARKPQSCHDQLKAHAASRFRGGRGSERLLCGRRAMEALVDDGLAKSIGVSNFSEAQIDDVLGHARIPPAVNQVELHPLLAQRRLVGYCMRKVQACRQPPIQACQGCAY